MNIVILSFYSGHLERGTERWTKEMASRLSERHSVVVLQNGKSGSTIKYPVRSADLPVNWKKKDAAGKKDWKRRFFIDYWSLLIARFTINLLPYIWKRKFDIIIPTDGGWEPALIRILTWFHQGKMVIVGHAGLGWDDKNNLWCFPDRFVALSKKAEVWAQKVNPFVKVETIPDGIDLSAFKPDGEKLDLKIKHPLVLCVSALNPGKRIDLVIKAAAKLKDISLLVAGEGDEKDALEKLGKKLLGNRFLLTSFTLDEMPKVYRSADIFTSASMSYYSFEMVILEALATNLPVVVNDDDIRKEIVGDAGYLVDPENTESYSETLRKSLEFKWEDKPRKQAEKFAWDKVIEEYENLFSLLLSK